MHGKGTHEMMDKELKHVSELEHPSQAMRCKWMALMVKPSKTTQRQASHLNVECVAQCRMAWAILMMVVATMYLQYHVIVL